jgi:hypothetical protein
MHPAGLVVMMASHDNQNDLAGTLFQRNFDFLHPVSGRSGIGLCLKLKTLRCRL